MLRTWSRQLRNTLFGRPAKASSCSRPGRKALLCLERLEDRLTPSLSAVGNVTKYPSSAVVELQITWQNGHHAVGTGVMIDSFHVLTAAHCIYSYADGGSPQNPNGGFAAQILVTPALSGNSAPFGTANMVWERVTGIYMSYSASHPGMTGPGSQDIGLITLDKAIGKNTGWLGMWYWPDDPNVLQQVFGSLTVSTAGYPGSNAISVTLQDGQVARGTTMYQESGATSGVSSDGTEIVYSQASLETHGGQSGSPLAIMENGVPSIVGIIVGDTNTMGAATRISQSCYNWLANCMNYDATNKPPAPAPGQSSSSVSLDSTTMDASLVSTSNGTAGNTPYTGTGTQPPPAQSKTTTTTVQMNPSVQAGQSLTVMALVTGSGSTLPTGTVTFYDGGTMLGQVGLSADTLAGFAYANWNTSSLSVGTHILAAVYSGDGNFQGSTGSASVSVTAPPPPPATLPSVANALTHSFEAYADFIAAAYQKYLGRAAAASEINGWVGAMQNGLSNEHVEAGFIGSAEYIANHGGPGAGWVRGLYVDLLGRTPAQSEIDSWVYQLANGMTPVQVAYGFAASYERESERVAADYQKYLGRAAATSEINGWVAQFLAGCSNESLIAAFVGSLEYWDHHGASAASWLDAAYHDVLGRPADAAADSVWLPVLQ
jgi:V8-like Glu-specific endopeptidase